MTEHTLDSILDLLNLHHRRATYGAVAKLVNRPPTFLMAGRTRDQRHSWVVNHRTGLPTGYEPEQIHPGLHDFQEILQTGDDLEKWLSTFTDAPDDDQAAAEIVPAAVTADV